MKSKYISFSLAILLVAFGASAQNLSTEIVVDRNIVPQERTAVRPGWVLPQLVLPDSQPVMLSPATYTGIAEINRTYSLLPAAEGAFAAEKSPYRGYLAAGYFPTLDFGVSAGYRFIDKKNLSLGAHLQFDTERYSPLKDVHDDRQEFINGTAGIDFSWRPEPSSALSVAGQYDFLRQETMYWHPQNVNSGSIDASWKSIAGPVTYSAAFRAAFEKDSKSHSYLVGSSTFIPGLAQQTYGFDVSASVPLGVSEIGMDVTGDYVHTDFDSNVTEGFVDITPYYSYSNKKFSAKIGVKVDLAHKVGVMPDVRLQWLPASVLAIWANATGGSQTNPFGRLRQLSVYQVFEQPFALSRIPFEVNGGINIGPFRGIYLGIFGGYAIADDWLMLSTIAMNPYEAVDVRGWHAGAKAGAEWRFIKAEVSADFAPSSYDRVWYTRRDHASLVVDASLQVNPISPLTLGVGYQFRNRRKAYSPHGDHESYVDMGCVSNLSAGAEWRFSPTLAAFARVENILGRQYEKIASDVSRKQSGLIGVSVKF